ncbi:uncharacterized protein EI97DRAFT_482913 [Westerdykella ornata]|uniref:DNA polymerase delta subunit 3 n=1 Tax=Westerdykella ornata TaxID=318751 RepID=A0A6A6JBI2_WESOR|nr:uncharacterized protein EI97DRAFT_482913 [Westerdykella ornata]KAF2272996.1 hypothetical protein EI97DRAFT_482913 [Westerdykella ornata]
MADKYKEYLATRVLAEGKPITYRLLSRALAVHVNTAKQMLYDFHTKQNARTPNSVHATYLITGRKRALEQTNGANGGGVEDEDTVMQSSPPYMSSMPDIEAEESEEAAAEAPVPTTTIVLVKEEELESAKAEFEEITSIQVYSLEPGPLKDMRILSVCNQEITTSYSSSDPLQWWEVYGMVHNPYIKACILPFNSTPRRTGKYVPPPTTASTKPLASKTAPKAESKAPAHPSEEKSKAALISKGNVSEDTSGRSTPQPVAKTTTTLKKSDSKPNLRKDASDIFKSFAKAKAKPKSAGASKDSTPAPANDVPMQGMSEDEGNDEDDAPEVKIDEEKLKQQRQKRKEVNEKLQQMMDMSDEEMADVEEKGSEPLRKEPEEETGSSKTIEPEPTATVTSQGGRRRGRRKVIKTKKVKDEDGYLVTREETVWESFSEDEPQPVKKPKPAPKPASTAKGKGGKMGQGSIANFFKKA